MPKNRDKRRTPRESHPNVRSSSPESNDRRTPLFRETQHWVRQEHEKLRRSKVDPWLFFNSRGLQVTDFYEEQIAYSGLAFEGSPQEKFWGGFIQPFLEDLGVRAVERAAERSERLGVSVKDALRETEALLNQAIWLIFSRMAEIDRRLRGKGYPHRVPQRDIAEEVRLSQVFVREIVTERIALFPDQETALAVGDRDAAEAQQDDRGAAPEVGTPDWRKELGRKAADARHSQPGGSREKSARIREIWASGRYSSRDICAEEECAGLGMSFSAARKALTNMPDPESG